MFNKMDEMEMNHSLKSLRIVYLYSVLFELTYWVNDCVKEGEVIFTTMFFLLCTQNVVLFISRYIYKIKVDDANGKRGIIYFIIITAVAIAIGILISWF